MFFLLLLICYFYNVLSQIYSGSNFLIFKTSILFHIDLYHAYLLRTAQRIFVERARPFCAHSCADGRITSLA